MKYVSNGLYVNVQTEDGAELVEIGYDEGMMLAQFSKNEFKEFRRAVGYAWRDLTGEAD